MCPRRIRSILQRYLSKTNKTDHILIAGDLNARIGKIPIPRIIGTNGEEHINKNGERLIYFVTYNDLKITNTFFKKRECNKFTWSAREYRSIIDYTIVNQMLAPRIIDTHVYRGKIVNTDNYLVKTKFQLWTT